MIVETGHFALILALFVAAVQAVVPLIGAAHRDTAWMSVSRSGAVVQFLLVAAAFLALTYAYAVSDFSVANVVANSHTDKPFFYKIAGVWGNHEGSLLLWVLILSLSGAAVALFGRSMPLTLLARVLAVQAMIAVAFLFFTLMTSNPFRRADMLPLNGRGLNPLLQDPGLVFHPPFLYLGYVGLSVAFSFAIAALIEGRIDAAWARWVRPWVLLAWCFLTLGVGLGSLWAYYELGWGGWWYWDPVENASLIPWLVTTALIHSIVVVEKRNALKSWTIFLAIVAFSCSLLGTFLVRSGVITSVHAFAVDPRRGLFILGLLIVAIGGSFLLFAIRAPALREGGVFAPVSREGTLLFNNVLLTVAAGTILLGTLYPLISEILDMGQVSVGAPYFNTVFVPIMIPMVMLMTIGPLLSWKRAGFAAAFRRLWGAFAAAVMVGCLTWLTAGSDPWWGIAGMSLAAWVGVGVVSDLAGRVRLFRVPASETLRRLWNLPRAAWGMVVAHAGMAAIIVGITGSAAWPSEKVQVLAPGESADLAGYTYTLRDAKLKVGPNYLALRGDFSIRDRERDIVELSPEKRTYTQPPMQTTEAAIHSTLRGDQYVVIGDEEKQGSYVVRLYYKPLVIWLWIGGAMLVLGGVIALADRRGSMRRPS